MKNIFVYGTLKKGYGNHRLLEGAELVYPRFIAEGYKLYESGIPYMKLTDNPEDKVLGEVYRVTEHKMLSNLDSLEGHPNWYRREVIDEDYQIEGYVYQRDVACPESPKIDGIYVYGRERRF